jgi:hypothetical protein
MKRMKTFFIWFVLLQLCFTGAYAQLEKIIVETYYVSDASDATDTTGGGLPAGSKTYRIYADLKPGSRVKKIFGSAMHSLRISSTTAFFNNKAYGKTFGYENTSTRLRRNTNALDSYITIGKACTQSTNNLHGIPKAYDTDGSLVGGSNNDGGSATLPQGLLTNNDPIAGRPLTAADGLMVNASSLGSFSSSGIVDLINQTDSTIFGSLVPQTTFSSSNMLLQNSTGVSGVSADSNQVLLMQLTTTGELSFKLNLEVEFYSNNNYTTYSYVSDSVTIANAQTEKYSPYLSYPFVCGCTDRDYLEYNDRYACSFSDSCKTKVKLGCTDKNACNYDSTANYMVRSLCCFPGDCQDRKIEAVCPQYNPLNEVYVYPNPFTDVLQIAYTCKKDKQMLLEIKDFSGNTPCSQQVNGFTEKVNQVSWDLKDLSPGIYILQATIDGILYRTNVIKIQP